MISDMNEKRCIAVARTLLFNYGTGIWTPVGVFRDCCKLLGEENNKLSPLPDFQPVEVPISFFSKRYIYSSIGRHSFCLFQPEEQNLFCSLPPGPKLNWIRNFSSMLEILSNFSKEEHQFISHILSTWTRTTYDYLCIPFSLARFSTKGN